MGRQILFQIREEGDGNVGGSCLIYIPYRYTWPIASSPPIYGPPPPLLTVNVYTVLLIIHSVLDVYRHTGICNIHSPAMVKDHNIYMKCFLSRSDICHWLNILLMDSSVLFLFCYEKCVCHITIFCMLGCIKFFLLRISKGRIWGMPP